MNIYALIRNWFNFCFEKKEAKAIHTALFMWCVERNNRLAWKPEFGLPTEDTMELLSIGNKGTYSSALHDLVDWGFIEIIQESKNQYISRIISICRSKNEPALRQTLDEAMIQHSTEQCSSTASSIVPIDIQTYNSTTLQTYKSTPEIFPKFSEDDLNLSKKLFLGISKNNPIFLQKFQNPENKNSQAKINSWADEIRKMRELDNIEIEQIDFVLAWTYGGEIKEKIFKPNSFWSTTCQSGTGLRKNFGKIVGQIQRDAKPPDPPKKRGARIWRECDL